MAYYRLYFLDGVGHIAQFHEFEADDDRAAVALADSWRGIGAMELWSGRRKVRRWDSLAHAAEARARSAVRALRLAS